MNKSGWKKKCNRCGEWKDRGEFHKQGKGRKGQVLRSGRCRWCLNEDKRERYREGKEKRWKKHGAYIRARGRALTRLSHTHPEVFQMLLNEELEKEKEYWV